MQFVFGAGVIWGTPLTDAYGNAISSATPIQLAVSQEISLDIQFDTKELYGQSQFPIAIGRGKGKCTGKAKFAQVNAASYNSLFFGQTLSAGLVSNVYDTTGEPIPAGAPYTITPTVPNTGTWSADLGVKDSNGRPMTKVASAPTAGQYSVAAGVYTFAAADQGKTVFINFQYTVAGATAGEHSVVQNVLMGYAPTFQAELYVSYQGKSMQITAYSALADKLTMMGTKLDDFSVPEIDFSCFADSLGRVLGYSFSE